MTKKELIVIHLQCFQIITTICTVPNTETLAVNILAKRTELFILNIGR